MQGVCYFPFIVEIPFVYSLEAVSYCYLEMSALKTSIII